MEFKEFTQCMSEARIKRYVLASDNSFNKAMRLYKANLKIAQAFHPLLGVFEVVIRNKLNHILTFHFSDSNWIINQKSGFMSDSSLQFTHKNTGKQFRNDFLKREITKTEVRLQKARTPITSGKIIAEQTLGFWTDLFEVHHYRLLKGKPIQIFKSLPSGHGRKQVNDELSKVRRFRNRINHNEPICFKNNEIDFTHTIEVHKSIINLLTWIDPNIVDFFADIDCVLYTIEAAKTI